MGYFCCISDFAYAKIILMNEGENSGMPNGPIFSSPNISGGEPSKQEAVPMPEEQVDITKVADPAVATTIASMPDAPEKPIVTSGGDPVDKKKPRFGLGTRRFKEKSQQPAAPIMQAAQTPAFANAPEFFNDAVGDIVLADAADAEKKNKTKKFIIIGAMAVAFVAVLVVGIVMMLGGNNSSVAASKLNRLANLYLLGEDSDKKIESTSNYLGEVKTYAYQHRFEKNDEYAEKLANAANEYFKELDQLAKEKKTTLPEETKIVLQESITLITATYGVAPMSGQMAYVSYLKNGSEKAKKDILARYTRIEKSDGAAKTYYNNALSSMDKAFMAGSVKAKYCAKLGECNGKVSDADNKEIKSLLKAADEDDVRNSRMLNEAYSNFNEKLLAILDGKYEK